MCKPFQNHTEGIEAVAFSSDAKHIASSSHDKTVRIWNTIGDQIGKLECTSFVQSVAFSPHGNHIVLGLHDKTIQIWEMNTTGQVLKVYQDHTGPVTSVAFSTDKKYIVTGSWDNTIKLWDAQNGQVWKTLKGHINSVNSVAFSSDGRYIVSGSSDKTIQIWDVERGVMVGKPLQRHTGSVNSVSFSSDQKYIASGSNDRTVLLWNFWTDRTGADLRISLQGHTGSVLTVAFSPDASYIASGSSDCTIRVWRVQGGIDTGHHHVNQITSLSLGITPPIYSPSSMVNTLHFHIFSSKESCPNLTYMQKNGWIVGPNGQLLLWIPPTYHSQTNTRISSNLQLDLNKMAHGSAWQKCYTSIS